MYGKPDSNLDSNGKLHYQQTREKFSQMLKEGKLDGREVEIQVREKMPSIVDLSSGAGMDEMGNNIKDMLGSLMPQKTKSKKLKILDAFKIGRASCRERV